MRDAISLSREGASRELPAGDIVYIASKNSVFAGPNDIADFATKADQAHQVRLLAVELGEFGIKVNGIKPRRPALERPAALLARARRAARRRGDQDHLLDRHRLLGRGLRTAARRPRARRAVPLPR